jgi:hypothetical protein
MSTQENCYIDLSLSKEKWTELTSKQQVDHLAAREIGIWAAGYTFALASPEQVATNQSRDPLGHERLYQRIKQSLEAAQPYNPVADEVDHAA